MTTQSLNNIGPVFNVGSLYEHVQIKMKIAQSCAVQITFKRISQMHVSQANWTFGFDSNDKIDHEATVLLQPFPVQLT